MKKSQVEGRDSDSEARRQRRMLRWIEVKVKGFRFAKSPSVQRVRTEAAAAAAVPRAASLPLTTSHLSSLGL